MGVLFDGPAFEGSLVVGRIAVTGATGSVDVLVDSTGFAIGAGVVGGAAFDTTVGATGCALGTRRVIEVEEVFVSPLVGSGSEECC